MLNPIPEYPSHPPGGVTLSPKSQMMSNQNKIAMAKPVVLRPQITKEYIYSQTVGRPDFQILHDGYENGSKFYEPQYSVIQNRKCHHDSHEVFRRPI